jgi:hypothetical protein
MNEETNTEAREYFTKPAKSVREIWMTEGKSGQVRAYYYSFRVRRVFQMKRAEAEEMIFAGTGRLINKPELFV